MIRAVCIDIESTGFSTALHEAWEVACVTLDARGLVLDEWSAAWEPVKADRDPRALAVNRFEERAADRTADRGQAIEELLLRLTGAEVVSYGLLDRRMVAELLGGMPWLVWVDLLPLARRALPHLRAHRLCDVAAACDADPGEAHRALDDARTLAAVYRRLLVSP